MNEPVMPSAPASIEAEQATLGSVFIDPGLYTVLEALLKPEDFFITRHGAIWRALALCRSRNEPVDIETAAEALENIGQLEAIGGRSYLMQLTLAVPSSTNAEYYAQIVKRSAMRRALLKYADNLKRIAIDETLEVEGVIARAEAELKPLLGLSTSIGKELSLDDMLEAHTDYIEDVMTGRLEGIRIVPRLPEIARYLPFYEPGGVYIVSGRPKMGKSSYGWAEAFHIAANYGPVLAFSLEMTAKQVATTIAANYATTDTGARIPARALWQGALNPAQYKGFLAMREQVRSVPLKVDYRLRQIEAIKAKVLGRKGLKAVVIDGGMLLQSQDIKRSKEYDLLTYVSRELQTMAKEANDGEGVVVILITQINRAGSGRPTKDNLKGTGAWEEDAAWAVALHRDNPEEDTVELNTVLPTEAIILISRNGSSGVPVINWMPGYQSYVSPALPRQVAQAAARHIGPRSEHDTSEGA